MLINFPVMNKQQVSTLSFLLLLSVLESLVKKISKILNCLFGRNGTRHHQSRERSQQRCYNIQAFLYNIEMWGNCWRYVYRLHFCTSDIEVARTSGDLENVIVRPWITFRLNDSCLIDRIWMRKKFCLQFRQIFERWQK